MKPKIFKVSQLQVSLTNHPVHFLHIVSIKAMFAFSCKLFGDEQWCVDVRQRQKQQEGSVVVPV